MQQVQVITVTLEQLENIVDAMFQKYLAAPTTAPAPKSVKLLNAKEAAAKLGVSYTYFITISNEIEGRYVGRSKFYTESDLSAFIETRSKPDTAAATYVRATRGGKKTTYC